MKLRATLLAMVALPGAALAQTTAIAPDVGTLGLGTTAAQAGRIVTIDGGTLAGGNLFHSFSQFSLGAGDTAQWVRAGGGAAGVSNVINRVTGGQVSQIAGRIDSSALPNASFYFINPAGVVFGAGAQVNVPGAAYFSTAGELRFAGGAKFAVTTPGGSTLSVAAPESFGFLGGQGAISMDGAAMSFAAPSTSLSLSASSIGVSGSELALKGIDLVGVGSGSAVVALGDPLAVARTGAVSVSGSRLAVAPSGGIGGALRIGGGNVTLDAANLASFTGSATRAGDIRINATRLRFVNGSIAGATSQGPGRGGDLLIQATTFQGENSTLYTLATTDGAGGRLALVADTIDLATMTFSSNATGAGPGGDLVVQARSLTADTAYLVSQAYGTGAGGAISITAPLMDLGGVVAFAGSSETGTPGDVVLKGDRISLNGGGYGSSPGLGSPSGNLLITADTSFAAFGTFFAAVAATDNSVGTISIASPKIRLENTFFNSESSGAGSAGVLSIQGKSLVLDQVNIHAVSKGDFVSKLGLVQIKGTDDLLINNSFIDSNSELRAQGGTISIEGGKVTLNDNLISADSNGDGRGGQVSVKADTLQVSNSTVSSNSVVFGDAGDVTLDARAITLDTATVISSETNSLEGNAGKVTIKGVKLVLDDATISSRARGGFGSAGTVTVDVDSLSLTDSTISSDAESLGDGGAVVIRAAGDLQILGNRRPFTSISSNAFSDGDAGTVTITAKTMTVRDQGSVSSNTYGFGNAGKVSIDAGSLKILTGGFVASDSLGNGDAGGVSVRADSLTIDGSGDDGLPTYISSDTLVGGNAGTVTINAGTLSVVHNGFIASDTFTGGNAGDVAVTAKTLTLQDGAAIVSQAFEGSGGDAGKISVEADILKVSDNSLISTSSFSEGDAGTVTVKARTLTVDHSVISSSAEVGATGASGRLLSINAGTVSVVNGGLIATVSNNRQQAGQITVTADTISIDGKGSAISSENQAGNTVLGNRRGQSGAAGAITLAAKDITISEGAVVSTNSFAGAAGEIRITMPPMTLLTLQGVKLPGAIQTSSGSGTGGKITISAPLAIVSNGGSILALGERRGANVVIESRYLINSSDRANIVAVDGEFKLVAGVYDVSAGTVNRDLSVLDASKVLRGQCPVTRSTGQVSQLITRQVGPYVRDPAFEPVQRPVAKPSPGVSGACF